MIYSEIKAPEVHDQVSEPIVMKSNAGYYVGRAYFDEEIGGAWFPHSRETDYFRSLEEAQKYLDYIVKHDMV